MMVSRTINFGWSEIKETYQATCRCCGKKYQRTTSTGYNNSASAEYRAQAREKLMAEAERLSKTLITCGSCQKAALSEAEPVELVSAALLEQIAGIEAEQAALDERKKAVEQQINQHRDRLFTHNGETFAQSSCAFGWHGDRFTVHGFRVSKTQPWETISKDVYAPLSEITYLNDTLANRKAKAREARTNSTGKESAQ
jgi:hypothetical protein